MRIEGLTTGCARVIMLLSVWSLLSAGGWQLNFLRYVAVAKDELTASWYRVS